MSVGFLSIIGNYAVALKVGYSLLCNISMNPDKTVLMTYVLNRRAFQVCSNVALESLKILQNIGTNAIFDIKFATLIHK